MMLAALAVVLRGEVCDGIPLWALRRAQHLLPSSSVNLSDLQNLGRARRGGQWPSRRPQTPKASITTWARALYGFRTRAGPSVRSLSRAPLTTSRGRRQYRDDAHAARSSSTTTGRGRPGSPDLPRDKPCSSCRSTCCLRRVEEVWGSAGVRPSSFPPWLAGMEI